MRKRMKRWLALTVAASLCIGSNPQQISLAKEVSDKTAPLENTEEGKVFKVKLDENGNIVSDNAADLEHRSFSWDNATVYFLLTDRFNNGDKSNDHSYGRGMQADGKTPVEGLDTYTNPGTFHGGDLKGLTEKVEDGYFTDLGVNAIWFTAVYEQIHGYTSGNVIGNNCNTYPDPNGKGFPYYSYHGYWALDYTNVDANWGDEKDFEKFVDACHEKGIRVVMDVVMNHLGYTTMQDAVDYGFDGALKGDWKKYYYGNSTHLMGGDPESLTYWDPSSSDWSKWWGPGFVRADYPGYTPAGGDDLHMSLCGMPDVQTESSAPEVGTPPILKTKWEKEGRLEKEQIELDDYFARTGNKKQPRYYIIKWLTDWVREYGVDGFRCDTAKHADLDAWKDLKTEAVDALKEWRKNNPDKPGADWTEDFWMTGECWGHGMSKSPYHTSGGFDSMVNFGFPKNATPSAMEGTYSAYAAMNEDPEWNTLSYINSHDDNDAAKVTWNISTQAMKDNGTCLLLTPGGAQIYYGNESNRGLDWDDFFTDREYLDQRFRSDMDWNNYDKECLAHWQKVGQFRNKHLAVGAGQHQKLDGDAYTFSRTYHLEEDDEDKVVCCLPGKAGTYEVPVGDVFEDGENITDFYSGEKYEVSGGSVSATCDENGVILLEGSGIVKASVGAKAKNKSATYSSDTIDITLKANKAKDTYYQINDGEKKEYKADDVITIGGDTAYEEKTKITLTGVSEDDGSELRKEVTYQRSKEPTVSDGEFALKVKKSDFPNGAPTVYAYSNDKSETPYTGKWPGDAMVEDDDSDYYVYKNEKITEDAMFILVSGSWRSTPDMQPGLVAKGCMLYDKTTNDVTEMPSGERGKVTINYVDQDGNELKSIYRVGVVGKKYTTYPAAIDGYRLVEEPDNASGVFETSSEVTYVYAKGDEVVKTQPPKTEVTETPKTTTTPKVTETPKITGAPSDDKEGTGISVSKTSGSSFNTETMDVEITLDGADSGTYILDGGPKKTFKSGDKVTVGQGMIADHELTLEVNATINGKNVSETFTYNKVFDANTANVRTSAVARLLRFFKIVAEAASVDAAAESDAYYATNPNGVGKEATITGMSDFTQDMLVARSGAWDVPNAFHGAHENSVADCYGLYAAWDDNNLYIGLEMVNTTDTWHDPGDGPLLEGGKMSNVPIVIAINTGKGNKMTGKCPADKEGHIWQCNMEFETRIDHLLFASAKGSGGEPGLFTADENGDSDYTEHLVGFKDVGITYVAEDGSISPEIMQIVAPGDDVSEVYDTSKYKDAMGMGHDRKYDTFFTYTIPLKALNIDKAYIESNGIGIMGLGTRQTSPLDCIPHDPSMLDNTFEDYTIAQDNTSHEKEDLDIITVPLAAVGNAKGGGEGGNSSVTTPTKKPDVKETEAPDDGDMVTATPKIPDEAEITATPTVTDTPDVTATPTATEKATPTPTEKATTEPKETEVPKENEDSGIFTVNFGADRSSPQLSKTELLLSAIAYGGEKGAKGYQYTFYVDDKEVKEAFGEVNYVWRPEAGNHKIKVVVEDNKGNKISSEKAYVIEANSTSDSKEDEDKTDGKDTVTNKPITTENPAATPKITEKPIITNKPITTEKPTATPKITEKPMITNKPITTEKPTTTPKITEKPITTESPAATPKTTEKPIITNKPGAGRQDLQVSISANKQSPRKAGTKMKLTVNATGGTAPYTYIITVKNGKKVTTLLSSQKKNSVNWNPTKAGTYVVRGKVVDAEGNIVSTAEKYTISSPISVKSFKLSKTTIKKGNTLKMYAKATSISKVKYQFKVVKAGAKNAAALMKYSTKSTYKWKAKKKGKHYIYLQVKDTKGNIKTVKKVVNVK